MLADLKADLDFVAVRYKKSRARVVMSSRGFHALAAYRLAHWLWEREVPLLPLVLSGLILILYGIDLDYRCKLAGGISIVHGTGIVIGVRAEVAAGTVIYHGVTLGYKGSRQRHDGFPKIGRNCLLGAGCKILGDLTVGDDSIIGPNVVLTESVPAHSLVRVPEPVITARHTAAASVPPVGGAL